MSNLAYHVSLGNYKRRSGKVHHIDVREFSTADDSLDEDAWLYVPTACEDKATICKLAFILHGCLMGK